MNKEWFPTHELAGIAGLPKTIQGINQKARREKWQSRKRNGIQGKAIEYHIDSLPMSVRIALKVREHNDVYLSTNVDPLMIWMGAFNQLNENEKNQLTEVILRHGIEGLVTLVKQYTQSVKYE